MERLFFLPGLRAILTIKTNDRNPAQSDTQSFPLEVKSSPKLWSGAYSPQEKFTQLDVASVVEFARLRGVRVIVEFDMPGHAGALFSAFSPQTPLGLLGL